MSKKTVFLIALFFIAPVAVYFLWPSDEARIRKLFREGAQAVEQKKTSGVMEKISFNYTDEHGLTYIILKDGFDRAFRQFQTIRPDYKITSINIREDKAVVEAEMKVSVKSGADGVYILGDSANPARVKFMLEKERTSWLVVKTSGIPLLLDK